MKKLGFGILFACLGVLSFGAVVQAQETGVAESADSVLSQQSGQGEAAKPDVAAAAAVPDQPKKAEDPEVLKKKIDLAKKMHQINPTSIQIDSAVEYAAKSLPDADRKPFVAAMKSVLNYNAVERISTDAMVDVFTLEELQSMVDYYSKPEAKSAVDKFPKWAEKVQPEIARMIDKAMMQVRTGGQ